MTQKALDFVRNAVREQIVKEGLRPLSDRIGIPVGQLRSINDGRSALGTTIEQVSSALGLEFYIGPSRDDGSGGAPAPAGPAASAPREIAEILDLPVGASMADAVKAIEARAAETVSRDEVIAVVQAKTESLREDIAARLDALADAAALTHPAEDAEPPAARPVDIVELDAAAGGGAHVLSEEVTGRVWFRRDWLDEHALDPTHCAVIGVRGESMEPVLPEGCSILIDRARTDWRPGRILLLRTSDGLIVKRAVQDDDGNPTLVSEHPAWDPVPLPDDAEIIGQVVWTARTLIGDDQ